ncbi:MAG: alpha/beta hydrolase [Betaproteobacteria bacterium RIFCSPLOWO2_12_FULL_62_13]|nr:MAG: alpha/beta hydrolase [Betaproteobacteria bacterium RIFCSPLOWO2_12_FULL_62_13]
MPYAMSNGICLYYEETGRGTPIVFVHEFADDLHSWEPQLRYFSRRFRCIAYNARGYLPSDVPKAASKYSQAIATDDIANVMRHLKLRKAHIIGCSMGGYATVHFGLRHARMALSLTAVGVGYGSDPDKRAQFLRDTEAMARRFAELGTKEAIKPYQIGPARVQFQNKDPRGFAQFCAEFAKHSALGAANTLRGVQARRPTIYSLERGLRNLRVPLHVVSGDEDNNCLEPGIFIKRVCPSAWLTVVPATGHAVNVEEPDLFNRLTAEFLTQVESGRWRPRDPRSLIKSTMGKTT